MKEHSPKKASLYSAVVPGLGQAYNRKYWKIPIIYAGAAALVYSYSFNQKYYLYYKAQYLKREANDPNDPTDFEIKYNKQAPLDQYTRGIDFYRRYRDMTVLGFAALYLANIIDATVDAYLFDYDVSEDLSLRLRPGVIYSPYSTNLAFTCTLRF